MVFAFVTASDLLQVFACKTDNNSWCANSAVLLHTGEFQFLTHSILPEESHLLVFFTSMFSGCRMTFRPGILQKVQCYI